MKTERFTPTNNSQTTALSRARARLGEIAGVKLVTTLDEVRLTQAGVSVQVFDAIKQLGAVSSELSWIIKPRTLSHRKSKSEPLTQEESGRWLRAAKMQALALEVFGNPDKASAWLHKARRQFGGQNAVSLVQTEAGAQLVQDTLGQIDSGYFA